MFIQIRLPPLSTEASCKVAPRDHPGSAAEDPAALGIEIPASRENLIPLPGNSVERGVARESDPLAGVLIADVAMKRVSQARRRPLWSRLRRRGMWSDDAERQSLAARIVAPRDRRLDRTRRQERLTPVQRSSLQGGEHATFPASPHLDGTGRDGRDGPKRAFTVSNSAPNES